MAAELQFDVAEQIFIRLDAKELMRCKCVCKSWQSLISDPCFVKAHLQHTCNSKDKVEPRIVISSKQRFSSSTVRMVGSSNGLVCISPVLAQLVITNPLTRELRKLPTLYYFPRSVRTRDTMCWGFGCDSSIDDYKVIVGLMKNDAPTRFLMLTLKTNTWEYIGLVNYRNIGRQSAILCNGALHWFMKTTNRENNENVILSFDLYFNEFKEIPLPDDENILYKSDGDHVSLGIVDGCLCICYHRSPYHMWVMKNYNVKESWEQFTWEYGEFCVTKSDIIHYVELVGGIVSYQIKSSLSAYYLSDPIFVQSLVSPHLYNGQQQKA